MFSGAEHWVPVPGTDDVDKRDTSLVLAETELRVLDENNVPVAWPYDDVTDVTYSYSKHPRWGLGASLAFFICLPCLAFAFLKKKNHWLGLETPDGPQLFKVSKHNYTQLIAGLQHAGIAVRNITDVTENAEQ